jgi:hypothetical protein
LMQCIWILLTLYHSLFLPPHSKVL